MHLLGIIIWHTYPLVIMNDTYSYSVCSKGVNFLLEDDLFSIFLVTVFIPVYLLFLRTLIIHFIPMPNMLKRIGTGVAIMVVSVICTFIMDVSGYIHQRNEELCMFNVDWNISQNSSLLFIQRCLSALSHMLINIALYEFICAQSPHSMKGLLIGLSFYHLL